MRPDDSGLGISIQSRADLLEFVRAVFVAAAPEHSFDRLAMDASFWDNGVESVVAAEMVAAVEDELGVVLPEDELVDVDCVDDLAAVIERVAGLRLA